MCLNSEGGDREGVFMVEREGGHREGCFMWWSWEIVGSGEEGVCSECRE